MKKVLTVWRWVAENCLFQCRAIGCLAFDVDLGLVAADWDGPRAAAAMRGVVQTSLDEVCI